MVRETLTDRFWNASDLAGPGAPCNPHCSIESLLLSLADELLVSPTKADLWMSSFFFRAHLNQKIFFTLKTGISNFH